MIAARVDCAPSAQVSTIGPRLVGRDPGEVVLEPAPADPRRARHVAARVRRRSWSTFEDQRVAERARARTLRRPRRRAASRPTRRGRRMAGLERRRPAAVHAGRPPASTATFGKPMRRSQPAVITERREAVARQDEPRRADGDVLVRRLHRLAARRPARRRRRGRRRTPPRVRTSRIVDVLRVAPAPAAPRSSSGGDERDRLVRGHALGDHRGERAARLARARAASGSPRARARGRPAPSPWSRSSRATTGLGSPMRRTDSAPR